MNEFEFFWLMTWVFGGFAVVSIVLMILEETLLRLFHTNIGEKNP